VLAAEAGVVRPQEDLMSRAKVVAGVVGTCLLILLAGWGFRMYSVSDPWAPYTRAVRTYLGAGLHGDSVALAAGSAALQPPLWVHEAIRQHPAWSPLGPGN
jgi:hypothetical protein